MDTSTPAWLSPPYYTRPDPVFVNVPQTGNYPSSRQAMAETMMEDNTSMVLGWPVGFLFGAAGMGNLTPKQFVDSLITYAQGLLTSPYAAITAAGFDPIGRAVFHANLIFDALKRIPAGNWLPNESRSVYDVWNQVKP